MKDQIELPEIATTAQIMELTGLSRDALAKHARAGHIRRISYGKWPFPETVQKLLAHYEQMAEARAGQSSLNLAQARARLARAQCEFQEIKRKRLEADLLPIDAVRETVDVCFNHVRSRVQTLPAVLAPKLATASSVAEAKEIATDAINELLTDLANTEVVVRGQKSRNTSA